MSGSTPDGIRAKEVTSSDDYRDERRPVGVRYVHQDLMTKMHDKAERSDPCPCGSGVRFGDCHYDGQR